MVHPPSARVGYVSYFDYISHSVNRIYVSAHSFIVFLMNNACEEENKITFFKFLLDKEE
ncbi:hypothetical protein HNQ64_000071 [Prosthecobacter dejongeii]|uniref:Uncharacterized protein n=1 Tax=Prosthecobacter dejongeii TaxID=48465 RepID=A0A7W8DN08_9BACT|nr:hypothetical protein [Prosthecobacter dejongeii]